MQRKTPQRKRLNTNTPEWKLQVARAIVAEKAPYFGTVLYSLYPVEVDKIRRLIRAGDNVYIQEMDTFGVTDKGLLLYTKKALEQWSEEALVFVLAHETLHVLLEHVSRGTAAGYDPSLYNIAADIFINDQLRQGNWKDWPPSICFPETWGFAPGLLADEYYFLLLKKRAEQEEKKEQRKQESKCQQCGKSQHGQGQKGKKSKQKGDQQGQGDGQEQQDTSGQQGGQQGQDGGSGQQCPSQEPGMIDGEPDLTQMGSTLKDDPFGHCGSAAGNSLENEANLSGEAREAERTDAEMEQIRARAAQQMADHVRKNPGSMGAGLERWAEAKLGPAKINWREHLRRALRRAHEWAIGQEDYRYGKVHRRQAGFGWGSRSIVLPTMIAPQSSVLVAVDTSGSMGPDELGIGLRELDGIFKQLKCKVKIVSCDAEVGNIKECRDINEAARSLVGGGGTSFVPIFDAVEDMRDKPDIVVVVTDGWGPAPEHEPQGYKTLWLLTGAQSQSPCQWGTHIKLDD